MDALLELIEFVVSAIGWLFGRRPGEDASSSPFGKLGMRYREIAEGRAPSGIGCLLVAALPWLLVLGIIAISVVAGIGSALTGSPDEPAGGVVILSLLTGVGVMFAGSVWLIRNARRPGRIDPVVVLTLCIGLDMLLLLLVAIAPRA